MRNLILIFFLMLGFNSSGQDLSKSLKYAFKKNDDDSLRSIIKSWNLKVNTNQDSIKNSYEKAVYSIFNEFYSPFQLDRIGSSEWGDSLNIGKIAIVQNRIKYAITEFPNPDTIMVTYQKEKLSLTEFENKYGHENSIYGFYEDLKYPSIDNDDKLEIKDFRPNTSIPKEQKLYLTSEYEREILEFLGNQHSKLGASGIMNPARATKKTKRRQAFLNNRFSIIYSHWGGYWHLETHPEVNLVILNPSQTKAVLYFRLVYEGGEAYLEKQDGQWKLVESKITWIE